MVVDDFIGAAVLARGARCDVSSADGSISKREPSGIMFAKPRCVTAESGWLQGPGASDRIRARSSGLRIRATRSASGRWAIAR